MLLKKKRPLSRPQSSFDFGIKSMNLADGIDGKPKGVSIYNTSYFTRPIFSIGSLVLPHLGQHLRAVNGASIIGGSSGGSPSRTAPQSRQHCNAI